MSDRVSEVVGSKLDQALQPLIPASTLNHLGMWLSPASLCWRGPVVRLSGYKSAAMVEGFKLASNKSWTVTSGDSGALVG